MDMSITPNLDPASSPGRDIGVVLYAHAVTDFDRPTLLILVDNDAIVDEYVRS